MNAGLKRLSIGDEVDEPAKETSRNQPHASIKQTAFHSTYYKGGDSRTLSLPETPRDWGNVENHGRISDLHRRLILRSAYLEALSRRSKQRLQMISQAIKSESRLKALSELLYPYRRRPLRWEARFFALFNSATAKKDRTPTIPISPWADSWFNKLFTSPTLTATQRWQLLSLRNKRRRWPDVMLRCLTVSADQSLYFLIKTNVKPLAPFELVMDALLYIKRSYGAEINSRADLQSQFVQVLRQQREPSRWIYQMEQKHLDLLLEDCTDEEGKDLFEKLLNYEIHLSYHCLLTLMGFFTRSGDIDSALKALDHMEIERRLHADEYLLSRCTNLLKLDHIVHDGDSPNFRILPRILEAGVKPNLPIHNLIMKNAVNLGAHVVAWDLYRYMQERHLPTSARTYLILMQDALARRDPEGLEEIFSAVHGRKDLSQNPYLIACTLNVIRVMYGHYMMRSSTLVFSKMLAVYCRAFSTAPLRHLRIIYESTRLSFSQVQVEPDANTLAFVVWAYVTSQYVPKVVESLFAWVEHLRSKGDETALALTRCLPYYDGFILFFARESSSLPTCLQIVQLMLDRGVEPSATTWGILVKALEKHGQFQAAEELRTMMGQKGVNAEKATAGLNMHQQQLTIAAHSNDMALESLEDPPAEPPSEGNSALAAVE